MEQLAVLQGPSRHIELKLCTGTPSARSKPAEALSIDGAVQLGIRRATNSYAWLPEPSIARPMLEPGILHASSFPAVRRHTFSHKVGREVGLEEALVLEGVVQLGVGHAAALEPAVENLVNALQGRAPLLAGDGEAVNKVPVQIRHL